MSITLIDKNEFIGIKISNPQLDKFQSMLEIVREYTSGYMGINKTESHDKFWKVDNYNQLVDTLTELIKIDEDIKNIDLLEAFKNRNNKETSKFRIKLNKELLKSEPLGDFQLKGIEQGIKQNRLMLAWEMGLGKTYTITSILNHIWDKKLIDKILIVAPSESVINFRREVLKFNSFNLTKEDFYIANIKNRDPFNSDAKVIIMTYRTFLMISDDAYFKKNKKKSKKYKNAVLDIDRWGTNRAIVLDESHCFTYNTLVNTNVGYLPIGFIVENKMPVDILSYNHQNGEFEYKKVAHYFKNTKALSEMLTIKLEDGKEITSTKNHPFFNGTEYSSIGDFNETDSVYSMRSSHNNNQQSKYQPAVLWEKLSGFLQYKNKRRRSFMQLLWKNLSGFETISKTILQHLLFCQMANATGRGKESCSCPRGPSKNIRNKKYQTERRFIRRDESEEVKKNEVGQPYVSTRCKGKNEADFIKNRPHFQRKRRKWHSYCSANRIIWSITKIWNKLHRRVCCRDKNCTASFWGKENSNKLQNRYSFNRSSYSNRNRWRVPLFYRSQITGSEKGSSFTVPGLESIKIQKCQSYDGYRGSIKDDITVYNLEVEDNNNYFVNGVLVHNCIKNRTARQSKVLNIHRHFFDFRYLLTGTPDPNGVEGFYNQINFLDKFIIGRDYYSWLKSIAKLGTKYSEYGVQYFYEDKVSDFIESIKPWVSREFTKGNIDLPELIIKNIYIELSDEQRKIYEELISYTLSIIKEEHGEIIPREVENKFPFILQALDNPSLLKGKIDKERSYSLFKRVEKWKFKDHSKLDACFSLVSKYLDENKKIIIWSGHPLTMNELNEEFKSFNPIMIHGQIDFPKNCSKEEHKNFLLEKFKTDKKHKILLASYYVLSTAVNITESSRSIYFDRSINPVNWMQSVKRNHRPGQTDTVIVNPLILENTYDERLDRDLNRKDKLNNNIMNRDSLTINEWKQLFLGAKILE